MGRSARRPVLPARVRVLCALLPFDLASKCPAPPGSTAMTTSHQPPYQADGLYDPRYEHDACGVAHGRAPRQRADATRSSTRRSTALENLEHRGAEGADSKTGDGAGILTQMPDAFFRAERRLRAAAGGPVRRRRCASCRTTRRAAAQARGAARAERRASRARRVLGWRDVPVDEEHVGDTANRTRPVMRQLFVGAGPGCDDDQDAFERKLYVIRRIVELAAGPDFYSPSFSSRTIVYKGMLIARPGRAASTPTCRTSASPSALALVHSRFSTNTFPSWELAHPFRVIAHNGEINTLMGNVNWMRARESAARLASCSALDLQKVMPIVRPGGLGLGDVRQRPRAADARRPLAAARGDDDDPRGLRRPRRPARRPQGLLRVPLVPDGAVGRPGGGRASPTAASSARRSTATACAPAAGARPRTAASSSAPRPGMLRIDAGRTSSASAACSRASCSSSTSSRAGSSTTTRSSATVATQQPYGEWFAAQRRPLRRPRAGARDDDRRRAAARRASSPSATRRRTCGS